MALDWLIQDPIEYVSRGDRLLSVLNGDGIIDVIPGRPDVAVDQRDWDKGEKFDPEIDFDLNSFSRADKFDGLEVGQEIIDSTLITKPTAEGGKSSSSSSEEK